MMFSQFFDTLTIILPIINKLQKKSQWYNDWAEEKKLKLGLSSRRFNFPSYIKMANHYKNMPTLDITEWIREI